MELAALLFVVFMPIAFLVWTLRFKTELALLTFAPLMMLVVVVLLLNFDATKDLNEPPYLNYTHSVLANQTQVIVSNTTTQTHNVYGVIVDHIPIGYTNLEVLNILMAVFVIVVAFIVLRRVTMARNSEEE